MKNNYTTSEFREMVKKPKKKTHPESQIQQSAVAWFRNQYPQFYLNLIKIDNETKCKVWVGAIKNREGRVAGASDLLLAVMKDVGNGICGGLWLETKSDKGKLSESQKKFAEHIQKSGYQFAMYKTVDEFKEVINNYLK